MFFIPHGFGQHSAQIFNQLSRLTSQGTVTRVASSKPSCPKLEQASAFSALVESCSLRWIGFGEVPCPPKRNEFKASHSLRDLWREQFARGWWWWYWNVLHRKEDKRIVMSTNDESPGWSWHTKALPRLFNPLVQWLKGDPSIDSKHCGPYCLNYESRSIFGHPLVDARLTSKLAAPTSSWAITGAKTDYKD